MERGASLDGKNSMRKWRLAGAESTTGNGKTNIAEATAGFSDWWQQDMLQAITPGRSWPQSI
jgi:hypothetical protein